MKEIKEEILKNIFNHSTKNIKIIFRNKYNLNLKNI